MARRLRGAQDPRALPDRAPALKVGSGRGDAVAAVVVEFRSGAALTRCVASLRAEGVTEVVVVDNGGGPPGALRRRLDAHADADLVVIEPGRNLGYGTAANRGVAATRAPLVLVTNPDVVVHEGAVARLVDALGSGSATCVAPVAFAGPQVREPSGARYPSARRFPSLLVGAAHGVLGLVSPANRFSVAYRMDDLDATATTPVDWVSGSCFLVDRRAFEELGGFDESYFMYGEDMDLCWRAHQAGWGVVYVPSASVTHVQGVSTAQHPYRMLAAHHRSILRFESKVATGPRRALLPAVLLVLAVRLAVMLAREATGRRRTGGRVPAE